MLIAILLIMKIGFLRCCDFVFWDSAYQHTFGNQQISGSNLIFGNQQISGSNLVFWSVKSWVVIVSIYAIYF